MIVGIVFAFFYTIFESDLTILFLFSVFVMLGICEDGRVASIIFQNKVAHFIAGISMEIYLCHMFVFRLIEKFGLLHITRNEMLNYSICSFVTMGGTIVLAIVFKRMIKIAERLVRQS